MCRPSLLAVVAPTTSHSLFQLARKLGIEDVKPFDQEAQAAADEAEVVAFVGDDIARAGDGKG